MIVGAKFPRGAWDPNLFAQVVLAEFGATGWMQKVHIDPPPSDPAILAAEIQSLRVLGMSQRPQRMNEIVGQALDLSLYWSDMLMVTPAAHPATWDLIAIAIAVGQLVGMHFKYKFARPRPVQAYPALMPPILTPSHPSYPNNHALQSRLIANFVTQAAPVLGDPCDVLATRIGHNREIAGLHYPSDRAASETLAAQITPIMQECALFQDVMARAKTEWQGLNAIPIPPQPT